MLRSFIALTIPERIQDTIAAQTAGLQAALKQPAVRWVATGNIHLTLKFLGDVPPSKLSLLAEDLGVEFSGLPRFSITLNKLGVYPDFRKPRVIWVDIDAPEDLRQLKLCVETICSKHGFDREGKRFSPHLTIGRVNQRITVKEKELITTLLGNSNIVIPDIVPIDSVNIYKSDLRPSGPIYSQVNAIPLAR